MDMIKIGDTVVYRPGFGMDPPCAVKVIGMDYTTLPRDKYGDPVTEASISLVETDHILFSMDNGHWSYSEQVDLEATEKLQEALRQPKDRLPLYLGLGFDDWVEQRMKE